MMGSMLQMQEGDMESTAITDGDGLKGHDYNDNEHECTISRSMITAAESAYGKGKMGKGVMDQDIQHESMAPSVQVLPKYIKSN